MSSDYNSELNRIVDLLNRSAGAGRERTAEEPAAAVSESLDPLLALAIREHASDLLLVAGAPVTLRVNGRITITSGGAMTAAQVRNYVVPLLESQQQDQLRQARSPDFGFVRPSIGRFRANIHHQRGTLAACFRVLPSEMPTLESLNLPGTLARFAELRQGLVLLTGPTGCGKSATIAALINLINSRRRDHIVTIEDPIEYEHPNRLSIIEQIEVGRDTPGFSQCMRSILRQSPDVILVGEMRDAETIAAVLTAAETGHLVFSTLHTNDTAQALSRILDSHPASNTAQIRQQVSLALQAVVAQQLVPSFDGRLRYPAVEIMLATDAIRHLIRKGEDHQLRTQIMMGRGHGMITMEQSLAELVRARRITRETALAHCFRADDMRSVLE